MDPSYIILGAFAIPATLIPIMIIFYFVPVPLWLTSKFSGVPVGLWNLFQMRSLQGIDPFSVVLPAITARYADVPVTVSQLLNHKQSGGNVDRVISALIAASKANIKLDWDTVTKIDLAGRDVLQAVQNSVNPKVMKTKMIEAIAQDGIQLQAYVLVTVRTDISRLIGSAGEETVLARVGEGIVTAIGKSKDFRHVLEHPEVITDEVMRNGLDSGTAFEILSIDIAEIDVGSNIGARLSIDQANADKQIAQARSEQRRAEAKAQQQMMKAKVEEMKAMVIEAEAEVPAALSEALESGRLSLDGYYKLQNLIADTKMRENIAGGNSFEAVSQI
jgi:uncharacterized protein YqfA (UPF0365 family)